MHRGGPPHTPHAKSCQCRPARLFVRAATACLLTKVQDQQDVLQLSARKCVWCREGRVARNVRHLIKTRLHLGVCGCACFTPPYGCVSRSLQTVHTHFGPKRRVTSASPLAPSRDTPTRLAPFTSTRRGPASVALLRRTGTCCISLLALRRKLSAAPRSLGQAIVSPFSPSSQEVSQKRVYIRN